MSGDPEKKLLRLQIDDLERRMDMMKEAFEGDRLRWKSEIEARKLDEQQRSSNFQESIVELRSQVASERSETRNRMRENVKLIEDIEGFFAKVAERSDRSVRSFDDVLKVIDELKEKRDLEARKAREMDEKVFEIEQEKDELEKKVERKSDRVEILKSRCERSMKIQDEEFEATLGNMKRKIKKQERMLAKMAGVVEQVKRENEELRAKSGQAEELEAKLEDQKRDSSIPVLEAQKAVLEVKLDEAVEKAEVYRNKIEELDEALVASNDRIKEQMRALKELKKENESLRSAVGTLNERSQKKSEKIAALEKMVKTLETNEIELQTEVSKLKLSLASRRHECAPAVCVKEAMEEKKSDGVDVVEVMGSLEECVKTQSEEIAALQRQRDALLEVVKKLDGALARSERFAEILQNDILKATTAMAEAKKEMEKRESAAEKRKEELVSELTVMLPTSVYEEVRVMEDRPFEEQITGIVTALVEQIGKGVEEEEPVLRAADVKCHQLMLSHLASACKLLRRLSGVMDSGYEKDEILKECARISAFVDEHEDELATFEDLGPLFDLKRDDPSVVAKTFHAVLGNTKLLGSSPFQELYMLFCCLIHANKILMNHMDDQQAKNQALTRKVVNIDDTEEHVVALEEWKQKSENEVSKAHEALAKYVDHPSENIVGLAEQICAVIQAKDKQLEIAVENARREQIIEENNKEIRKLKKQVCKQKREKKKFCQKADEVAADIQDGVVKMREEYAEQIEAAEQEIEDLNDMNTAMIANYQNKIETLRQDNAAKDEQIEKLNEEILGLKKEINTFFAKCSKQRDEITSFKEEVRTLKEQLARAIAHKNHYKQKVLSEDKRDTETLRELQEKTTELKTNYETAVSELTNELSTVKSELAEANAARNQFEKIKQDLLKTNAKLSLSERTLTVKLTSAQEQITSERSLHSSKEQALRNAYESKLSHLETDFRQERSAYVNLINSCSTLLLGTPIPESLTPAQLVSFVTETLDSYDRRHELLMSRDASEARKCMGVSVLTPAIKDLLQLRDEMKREIVSLNAENASLCDTLAKLQADAKWREENIGDCSAWISWARAILMQVSEGAKLPETSQKLRKQIEDILLNTMSKRRYVRKLEILRKEKKYLSSQGTLLNPPDQKRPLASLRPIIIALALGLRMKQNSPRSFV